MTWTSEQALADALELYLLNSGLPYYFAMAGVRLTRTIWRKDVHVVSADATRLYAALVSWFDQHDYGALIHSQEQQGAFEVQGMRLIDGDILRLRSPKLVLATISIAPIEADGATHAKITIENGAKVGYLSSRSTRQMAMRACEMVA